MIVDAVDDVIVNAAVAVVDAAAVVVVDDSVVVVVVDARTEPVLFKAIALFFFSFLVSG